MNQLQIFESEEFGQVRVINRDGEPWFVAKDICEVLELSNPSAVVSRLEDDERTKFNLGRQGKANMVNEYGLYNLILGSRKKEAKQFKRWITHEVLPELREKGQYSIKPKNEFEIMRKMIDKLEETEKEAREAKQIAQNIKDTIVDRDENWRDWVNESLNKIAFKSGKYKQVKRLSYDILENRARCRLKVRLQNLKDRLEQAGARKSVIKNANKLDVIERDKRLKEIYTSIVKELVIKHSA
ncbi:MAG: Bro-N domain-containing protein [Bacteroidales bacterium]